MKTIAPALCALTLAVSLAACNDGSVSAAPGSATPAPIAAPASAPAPATTPAPAPAAAAKPAHEHTHVATAQPPAPPPVCHECGTIVAIEKLRSAGEGTGMGAVAGAIAGAVIGHQFGQGKGKDVATAGGAVAGGVAGHMAEKQIRATTNYRVTVRMEDDTTRVVEVESADSYAVGAHVKVIGEALQPA